jgi:hypothetical protein
VREGICGFAVSAIDPDLLDDDVLVVRRDGNLQEIEDERDRSLRRCVTVDLETLSWNAA